MFRFGAIEKSYAPFLCAFRFSPHQDRRRREARPMKEAKWMPTTRKTTLGEISQARRSAEMSFGAALISRADSTSRL